MAPKSRRPKAKVSTSELSGNGKTDARLLNGFPPEIMETIFGELNFVDLPNLLQVSKKVNVFRRFNAISYISMHSKVHGIMHNFG